MLTYVARRLLLLPVVLLGVTVGRLEQMEGGRGSLAAWMLIGFGLAYTAWGLRQAHRNRRHTHWHHHDGITHAHEHSHHDAHAHVHQAPASPKSLTPWVLFVIFILGPCEPLIPLLMYPAARVDATGVIVVTAVFGIVTVVTMLMAVAIAASAAFLTPIGHKNNTLILGPGGYGFGDYWRMGLPLEILVVAVSIPAILVFWPL